MYLRTAHFFGFLRSTKNRYALLALGVFILLFLMQYLPAHPQGQILADGWTVRGQYSDDDVRLPYVRSVQNTSVLTFSTHIQYMEDDVLLLVWPYTHAAAVSFNDQIIYAVGNLKAPTALIRDHILFIRLPDVPEKSGNLKISLGTPSNVIGLRIEPYILPEKIAQTKVIWGYFLSNELMLLSIGSAIFIGIFLISISRTSDEKWNAELFMGIASICAAIYCFDYTFRISTGSLSSYLFVRKILLICGYLAASAFVFGLEKYYSNQFHISWLLGISSLISIVLIAFQPSMKHLDDLMVVLVMFLFVNLAVAIYLIIRGQRGHDWLIVLPVLMGLALLEIALIQIFNFSWPYVLQYIVLISANIFGINLMLEFERLSIEKKGLERQVNIDPLTGVFNRKILEKINLQNYDALIFTDLDHFKEYNDLYGHQKGDQLLKDFAKIVRRNLRQNDLIIRYGGDEFLLLLSKISQENAELAARRIQEDFEMLNPGEELSVSYGIDRVMTSLKLVIERADQLMYSMKRERV